MNIVPVEGYKAISLEKLIELNPARHYHHAFRKRHGRYADKFLCGIGVIRTKQVYVINACGYRLPCWRVHGWIVDALEEIVELRRCSLFAF